MIKPAFLAAVLAFSAPAGAAWYTGADGFLYSNICRAGYYWGAMPGYLRVGSPCRVIMPDGRIYNGMVVAE